MTPAISVAGLTRRYRGELALSDVTLDLEPESITGPLGRNGAGKTTFLRILAGHEFARATARPGLRGTVVVACGGECTVNPGPDADALFGPAARARKPGSGSRWPSTARPGSCPGSPIRTVRTAGPRSRAAR
jgi:energy-coupling factor transporter ATP-binding protein EcfA2